MQISIFYSWQSDNPAKNNRHFINLCLQKARSRSTEIKSNCEITIDEATRDISGSPNIPLTIIEKIKRADIFVCDVTTINANSSDSKRTPNPNVVFELGFAVATLGWNRVILLFNKAHGTFPGDMPFDFDRHRVNAFTCENSKDTDQQNELTGILFSQIKEIIENNPSRSTPEQSPEEKKRSRDIEVSKWALSKIHLPTIDQHIIECTNVIRNKTLHFWEGFNSVIENSLFHLYDEDLYKSFLELHAAFLSTVEHWQHFHPNVDGSSYIFNDQIGFSSPKEKRNIRAEIANGCEKMNASLKSLLKKIRENYLEIDVAETSNIAWREYIAFENANKK